VGGGAGDIVRDAVSAACAADDPGGHDSGASQPNVDRATYPSLGDWDGTTSLGNVSVPTLIIQGELDPLPIQSARDWAATMPNARLLELKGIGHFPLR
jgi:pimeloyl-ACP methyl ester carboxylesterase